MHKIYFGLSYWHRSLNPKKLIDVKFSYLQRNMTMQRTIKLYRLPETPKTLGFRKMTEADCPEAFTLLYNVDFIYQNFKSHMINFKLLFL